ncbi:MAG TPA: PilZ domain-containing protein [Pyrinomonadaceae bacterium]|nr:PilZ domain-containing protein [Pyrinomonadaceae bacterium]
MSSTNVTKTQDDRRSHRLSTDLKTIVQVKESVSEAWKEVTAVSTVSKNGAGFTLTKKVEVGRLVSLVLPMPVEFRAYDEDAELYPVLGLVQHVTETNQNGNKVFQVGVGFVGKEMPESFKADPKQNYRFSGVAANGLWTITEANSQFKPRKNPRFWRSIELTVSQMKRTREDAAKVRARSKDISASGLSVGCDLEVELGEKVKIACVEYDFYSIAEVRNRKVSKDGKDTTLHLQFVDEEFPMHKLLFENGVGSTETNARISV